MGLGELSLQIKDVTGLASGLVEILVVYRNLQGPSHDLKSLLGLLAMRQADINCVAFSNPQRYWSGASPSTLAILTLTPALHWQCSCTKRQDTILGVEPSLQPSSREPGA